MIKKEAGQFTVYSQDGKKKLGSYAKKSDAMKRSSQIKDFMSVKAAREKSKKK